MEEVYMIPKNEMDKLIQYYKGELTENAQLTKAAKLAAEKHVLLNSGLPPPIINAKTKPLSQELMKLTKRIRQFPGGVGPSGQGGIPGEDEEEGDLVTGPVEQWLKQMIKGTPSTPKPTIASPSKKGKAASTSRIPVRVKAEGIQKRLSDIRERRKALLESIDNIGKGKGKGKGKGRGKGQGPSRELEKLKPLPDWEDWAKGKKLRRKLDYDDSD